MAAAGLAAAPAQAHSGKIYACYSKSTHVMKYSKKAHCSSGKSLSWNKMGPQGAQGARGAQGPAGVANVGYHYATSQVLSLSRGSSFYSGVVDTFVPTVAGSYEVNTADTLKAGGTATFAACWAFGKNGDTESMRASVPANEYMPIATTGVVFASPANPVGNYCSTRAPATVFRAAVDGIQANKVNGVTPAVKAKSSVSPRQHFRPGLKK
jgi:hypothetical protein